MEINEKHGSLRLVYLVGSTIILMLPLLSFGLWFFPPEWGKVIVFRIIMVVMAFLFLWQFLYKREEIDFKNIAKNKIIWLLIALLLIYFTSSLFSPDPYFSFFGSPTRAGGLLNFAFYVIFAIFVFLVARNEDYKALWFFSVLAGVVVSFWALMQYYRLFSPVILSTGFRPSSTIGNPIFLGIYLLILLFPCLAFLFSEKKILYRIFYGVVFLLFFFVILISGSRAAYLGFLVGAMHFILFYPKKLRLIKIGAILALILAVLFVAYVNIAQSFPKFLENSSLFHAIHSRLLLKSVAQEARFPTWMVGMKVFFERPILGWGMENFSIGFNKYYDHSIENEWWDKPHNIFLQAAVEGGIFALVAYVAVIFLLFWNLRKVKHYDSDNSTISEKQTILINVIQSGLLAYLVANFFGIDSFPTYILFFLMVAYVLNLVYVKSKNEKSKTVEVVEKKSSVAKFIIIMLALLLFSGFLWQYNILPLSINKAIVLSDNLSKAGLCDQATSNMDEAISFHSFLDSYMRLRYVELIKNCADFYPQKTLDYVKKSISLLKESSKIQPTYPRTYIYIGSYNTILASLSTDERKKSSLIQEAYFYFNKADELAPDHKETLYERTRTDMVAKDYLKMQSDSEKCVQLYPDDSKDCYWSEALSYIYLKDYKKAAEYVETSSDNGINPYHGLYSIMYLYQLMDAYSAVGNDQGLLMVYQKMQKSADQCIQTALHNEECYWLKGLSYAYLKDYEKSAEFIDMAKSKGFDTESVSSLYQLINTYNTTGNYQKLAEVYEKLTKAFPLMVQYHSSLALTYRQIGQFQKAKEQALIILQLAPETKNEIGSFIKTLH